jgi:antitoxin component YwqK of YwqJK toxin-antitoxin module
MARLIKKYTNYGTLEAEYFVVPNSNGEDIIEGEYKEYTSDGKLWKVYNYSDDKKNGLCTLYDFTSHTGTGCDSSYETGEYVNDKKHGTFKTYTIWDPCVDDEASTSLQKICNYNNGVLDGYYKEYINYYNDDDYQLKISCNYINGVLDGEYIEYYDSDYDYGYDNQLKISCKYVNGEKTDYKEYHIDGSLVLPVEKKQLYVSGKLKSEFFIV